MANDIENLKILEKKIKDIVYKAEDRVDSCLTNMILADNEDDREKACKFFNEELQQVKTEFDSLGKEVMVIELNKRGSKSTELAAATTSFSSTEETTYVGMKNDRKAILNCLNAQTKELIVISLVGMGGIGKTTLARKVFDNSTIRDRFEKHAWVTISEQYNKRQMLLEVMNYNVDNSKEDIINYQRRVMLLLNIDMRHVYLPEHGSGIKNTTRSFVVMRNPNEVSVICPITSCFKVLDVYSIDYDFSCVIPQLVHLIYVAANIKEAPSVARLWNLQTIILDMLAGWIHLPLEIWTMSNVRHLEIGLAIVMANQL